jgi:cardiolipin synthase
MKTYMPEIEEKIISKSIVQKSSPMLIESGKTFFSKLESVIKNAKQWIHLQFYIFQSDETGLHVAGMLEDAAAMGIQVYLLVDSIGSPGPENEVFKRLVRKGIHLRHFEPFNLFRNGYLSRRLHHKIVVNDQMDILMGGINIANRYNDMDHEPAWLDLAVYTRDPIAIEIKAYCEQVWQGKYPDHQKNNQEKPQIIRFIRNDWRNHLNEISIAYLNLFKNTKTELIVLCSYFLPGKALRRSLKSMTERNVSVILITTKTSDVPVSKHAERWLYDWLFRNKVRIFEFQKNVLHAKLVMADGNYVNTGSYNINNLSAYGSLECNLEIKDACFGNNVRHYLNQLIQKDCIEVTRPITGRKYGIAYQFACWLSYHFLQGLLYISTNGYQRKSINPKIRRK